MTRVRVCRATHNMHKQSKLDEPAIDKSLTLRELALENAKLFLFRVAWQSLRIVVSMLQIINQLELEVAEEMGKTVGKFLTLDLTLVSIHLECMTNRGALWHGWQGHSYYRIWWANNVGQIIIMLFGVWTVYSMQNLPVRVRSVDKKSKDPVKMKTARTPCHLEHCQHMKKEEEVWGKRQARCCACGLGSSAVAPVENLQTALTGGEPAAQPDAEDPAQPAAPDGRECLGWWAERDDEALGRGRNKDGSVAEQRTRRCCRVLSLWRVVPCVPKRKGKAVFVYDVGGNAVEERRYGYDWVQSYDWPSYWDSSAGEREKAARMSYTSSLHSSSHDSSGSSSRTHAMAPFAFIHQPPVSRHS